MTARWDWPLCGCAWNRYAADCHKPFHVVLALRDLPHDLPLILSAPVGDFIPQWVMDGAA